jgi:hypothetical protein
LQGGHKSERGDQMMKQLTTTKIGGVFLIAICIMFSACGELPVAAPAHLPPCYPARNAYAESVDQDFINIYNQGIKSIDNIDEYNKSRQAAFNQLVNRVYYWSDSVDINTGEKSVRVTITYVSPELTHLIILNHYLYKRIAHSPDEVEEQVKNQMSRIIGNKEHIFLIVFMAPPSVDGTTIQFPLNELTLTNANNLTVYVEHDDHNLERPFVLKTELEYGFFYIPMTVIKDGSCQTVLDKNIDTRIFLNVPRVTVNDTNSGLQSWEYEYAPLIDMETSSVAHQDKFLLAQQIDQITPDTGQLSSGSGQLPSVDLNNVGYWIAMARFIWYETTLDP